MHWFLLLIRNGVLAATWLLVVQMLVPVLYLWAIVPLGLGLVWALYATGNTLWQRRLRLPGWGVVGVCWGVFVLATGMYIAANHLRRGHPLTTLVAAEPALPTFWVWGLMLSLLVVAAVWWQHGREAKPS